GAGTILKAASGWNTGSGYIEGTDDHGFSAIPGGIGYSYGSFLDVGDSGLWWSATQLGASDAWSRGMFYDGSDVGRYNGGKSYLLSVRCVRDSAAE
ncbi:MAG: hypothetical protein FWH22_11000, partial [Fibromonadales bacterium]|nr:hypothetical protein [Fibromonadales bacterium]